MRRRKEGRGQERRAAGSSGHGEASGNEAGFPLALYKLQRLFFHLTFFPSLFRYQALCKIQG